MEELCSGRGDGGVGRVGWGGRGERGGGAEYPIDAALPFLFPSSIRRLAGVEVSQY